MTTFDKYRIFENFYSNSESLFCEIHENDSEAKVISNSYGFCVCPGGSNGGLNKRVVEVFWGNRPFDKTTNIDSHLKVSEELLIEHGAILYYYMLDNGNILVELIPAKSKGLSPSEEFIIIDFITNPQKLNNKYVIKWHWLLLKSYMNITSLRGKRNFFDKMMVFYLRNFKEYSLNTNIQQSKFYKTFKNIMKFVISVGLSGFLIFLLSFINGNIESHKKQKLYDEVVKNQIIFIEMLKNTNANEKLNYDILNELNSNVILLLEEYKAKNISEIKNETK